MEMSRRMSFSVFRNQPKHRLLMQELEEQQDIIIRYVSSCIGYNTRIAFFLDKDR